MAALSGEKMLAELASQYGVHPTMISTWREVLIENAKVDSRSRRNWGASWLWGAPMIDLGDDPHHSKKVTTQARCSWVGFGMGR